MSLHLHEATKVSYFFSILFNSNFGTAQDVFTLLQTTYPELQLEENLFFPQNNPLLGYYHKQMGQEESVLKRFFCYAKNPLTRDFLPQFKLRAFSLENSTYNKNFRLLNIDPGFVAQEQMILSSHKPFTHRIYLQHGIYAELEYLFRDQKWHELPWTYPDYNDEEKKLYFMSIRRLLL